MKQLPTCNCTYSMLVQLGYHPTKHHPDCPYLPPHNPDSAGDEASQDRLVGGQMLTTHKKEEHTE